MTQLVETPECATVDSTFGNGRSACLQNRCLRQTSTCFLLHSSRFNIFCPSLQPRAGTQHPIPLQKLLLNCDLPVRKPHLLSVLPQNSFQRCPTINLYVPITSSTTSPLTSKLTHPQNSPPPSYPAPTYNNPGNFHPNSPPPQGAAQDYYQGGQGYYPPHQNFSPQPQGYYGQPPGQMYYPPQQGYYAGDRGRQDGSSAGGICAGIMAAMACCCCLDILF